MSEIGNYIPCLEFGIKDLPNKLLEVWSSNDGRSTSLLICAFENDGNIEYGEQDVETFKNPDSRVPLLDFCFSNTKNGIKSLDSLIDALTKIRELIKNREEEGDQ